MEQNIEYNKEFSLLKMLQHDPLTLLRLIRERNKENRIKRISQEMKNRFQVRECGGRLWITHDGVAVKELERDMSTDAILRMLREIRECAIAHREIGLPYTRHY